MTLKISGDTDRLSAAPGQTIRFMVNCERPTRHVTENAPYVSFYEAAARVNCVPPVKRIQCARGSVTRLFTR
jgi:hypothetical protein